VARDGDQVVLVAGGEAVVDEGLELAEEVVLGVVVVGEDGQDVDEGVEAGGLDEDGLVAEVGGHLRDDEGHGEVRPGGKEKERVVESNRPSERI